jgi:alkanesulfonate monooxygenase SsuD/methylene tetrahydromethanopterin reductase-like flavin-dependent oxidoreductase (luciferase family)
MRFGARPWSQSSDWPALRAVGPAVESAGWDALYTWDHLQAIQEPWQQPIFEGWLVLATRAELTERVRIGLMVGANTFRNPGHTAKLVTTLDHLSGGRAILGIGGAGSSGSTTRSGSTSGRASASDSTDSTRPSA